VAGLAGVGIAEAEVCGLGGGVNERERGRPVPPRWQNCGLRTPARVVPGVTFPDSAAEPAVTVGAS
jgi:hypothetical protein